jgi:hypothetical protein
VIVLIMREAACERANHGLHSERVRSKRRLSRLLKKAHLRSPSLRLGTRPLGHSLRRNGSTPGPTCGGRPISGGYPGPARAAWHLDLFEQPGRKRVIQQPVSTGER